MKSAERFCRLELDPGSSETQFCQISGAFPQNKCAWDTLMEHPTKHAILPRFPNTYMWIIKSTGRGEVSSYHHGRHHTDPPCSIGLKVTLIEDHGFNKEQAQGSKSFEEMIADGTSELVWHFHTCQLHKGSCVSLFGLPDNDPETL